MADNMFTVVDNEARNDVINAKRDVVVERSVFPYGRSCILPMNEGYIYPVDCFMTLPGDSIDIDFASYLESLNPFSDRQYSGMKLSFHVFYNKCEHEWKGWKAFATKGIRGNINLTLPFVHPSGVNGYPVLCDGQLLKSTNATDKVIYALNNTPASLSNYLTGLHFAHVPNQVMSSLIDSSSQSLALSFGLGDNTQVNRPFLVSGETGVNNNLSDKANAIPFSMYQRTFRKFYLNQNLVKDNKHWFPDDDDDFVLPYSGGHVKFLGVNGNSTSLVPNQSVVPNNYTDDFNWLSDTPDFTKRYADYPVLDLMRCRQYGGDSFTTVVPFLERNGVTKLWLTDIHAATSSGSIPNGSLIQSITESNGSGMNGVSFQSFGTEPYPKFSGVGDDNGGSLGQIGSFLSLNNLRELSAATLWSERNARARGDYDSLIQAHYSRDPNSGDREPIYLGGSVQHINFDSVVSQSETTNQPLGYRTSVASCGARSSVKHFECPDFGYVMILASLVPDTFYTQGLREEFDPYLLGTDLPWPEFGNLQKENVLLKRLYYTNSSSLNDRLIGYNERFLNWKYRPNVLLGNFNDSRDLKFRSMTFARYFDYASMSNLMSINNEFVTCSPYNCRSDMYTVPSQPHFTLQFGDNVRIVRALPFAARESALTNIA